MKKLFQTYLEVLFFELKERKEVARRFWSASFRFFLVDVLFFFLYLFSNPYRMCRRVLARRGEKEIDRYGETPITTLSEIAQFAGIGDSDTVYELGCGRGRSAFWLTIFCRCRVLAIDIVPGFIQRARFIQRMLRIRDAEFICGDLSEIRFDEATCVFFYGTGFDEIVVKNLIERLKRAENTKALRIITVSYPLSDFSEKKLFSSVKSTDAVFPWGTAEVFLQVLAPFSERKSG